MKLKHTPTPWRVADLEIWREPVDDYPYGWIVASLLEHIHRGPRDNAAANADFIVRACNAHDDLVELLERLVASDDENNFQPAHNCESVDSDHTYECPACIVKDAIHLLKKAKGDS
mgnify:CR=1 FL=1